MLAKDHSRFHVGAAFGDRVVIGQPFVKRTPSGSARWVVPCRCACGREDDVAIHYLGSGVSAQCRLCGRRSRKVATHGLSHTRTYSSWRAMMSRCYRPGTRSFHRYGGRGVSVNTRWHTFENFLIDMGERPGGTSLDRNDSDSDYGPGLCSWSSVEEQAKKRNTSLWLEAFGKRMILADWAREVGIQSQTLRARLRRGWSVERTMSTPKDERRTTRTHTKKAA